MKRNQPQNYQNHKKITPLQHYILMPLALILLILAIVYVVTSKGSLPAFLFLLTSIGITILGMLARMYAMKLQDRIIWNEVNFRHIQLTGQPLDTNLQLRQVIALRFAEDDEFLALCQRAVGEGMAPDAIKRHITRWRADDWRV
ncbi:hypothetical protein KDC22_24435 [Paenibacillus tritici]|uniref:DUF6526 family protein n=1 Tax=Paenibacillus tritici TaxID=1873425 RepID=UPI001BA81CE0|nr:DUF6526 family protein [Paenibacillus tritici]QUL53503.1 hypothetical protein KDC22_24435 [Paenibacillus tritici]